MPGTPVALPATGIELSFSDFGLPGDFWIVAARPNTPELVVPWRLLDAAAPMGPQRFYAPLGLVHWSVDASEASATVEDCRHQHLGSAGMHLPEPVEGNPVRPTGRLLGHRGGVPDRTRPNAVGCCHHEHLSAC